MMITVISIFLIPTISSAFLLDSFGLSTNVQVVQDLDAQKYLGRWYQIYASQSVFATFERNAYCVTADYTMSVDGSGKIIILNSERLTNQTGPIKVIHGYATTAGAPGKLSVHLESVSLPAPYWVLKLGPSTYGQDNKYQYAVVSDNIKATLFVLARDPVLFKRDYEAEVLQFLHEQGFTSVINKPQSTYHGNDCIYNDQHS